MLECLNAVSIFNLGIMRMAIAIQAHKLAAYLAVKPALISSMSFSEIIPAARFKLRID